MSNSAIQEFIAKGQGWSVGSGNISIGGGSSFYVGIKVGGNPVSLVRTSISTDSNDLLVTVYSRTGYEGGTIVPEINRNDNFRGDKKPTFETFADVTPDPLAGSNILIRTALKSGRFEAVNESTINDTGIVLATNTRYVIEFKNNDGQSKELDFSAVVYSPASGELIGG